MPRAFINVEVEGDDLTLPGLSQIIERLINHIEKLDAGRTFRRARLGTVTYDSTNICSGSKTEET